MTIETVNEMIDCYEKKGMNFNNCMCLASLYTIKDHFGKDNGMDSLMRAYSNYKSTKKIEYLSSFVDSFKDMIKVINDFGTPAEKDVIRSFSVDKNDSLEIKKGDK